MKRSLGEKAFNVFNIAFLVLFCISTMYPLLNILAISLNEGKDAMLGGITIFPRKFTLFNYEVVFRSGEIFGAFLFSVFVTILRTVVILLTTAAGAYSLTKKDLIFKKSLLTFFLIPMFISGGLVPYYLLIRSLGLMNNILVYILPITFDFYNAIIMRVYFQANIPESLVESAYLDGATDFGILARIVLPLSKPMLAAMALFIGVWAWNDWMTTMLFCSSQPKLWTLQFLLQRLVMQTNAALKMAMTVASKSGKPMDQNLVTTQTITYATLMVATLPIVVIYPFLQKYFVSGLMLGSVKG